MSNNLTKTKKRGNIDIDVKEMQVLCSELPDLLAVPYQRAPKPPPPQYLYPLRLDLMRAAAEFIKISPLHKPPSHLLKTTNSTFSSVFHLGLPFLQSVSIMPKFLLTLRGMGRVTKFTSLQ
jgi:hypothetical protein